MNLDVHFSSKSDEWATPQDFFDKLAAKFDFTLDTCATPENAKCPTYYTIENSGLDNPWHARNWCNPPYSEIKLWVGKARREQLLGNITVVLIPSRTDTAVFQDSIYNQSNVESDSYEDVSNSAAQRTTHRSRQWSSSSDHRHDASAFTKERTTTSAPGASHVRRRNASFLDACVYRKFDSA